MFFLEPSSRPRVKVCGIANREDALAAIALGVDALGFNLFPGSKRCILLDAEAEWIAALPKSVARVAVLVNGVSRIMLSLTVQSVAARVDRFAHGAA